MDNGQKDPYSFITNPEKPPKAPLLPSVGGNPMITRILVVAGGLILLITLIIIGMSVLNSSSNAQSQKMLEVAQAQTEILRIADSTNQKISGSELNDVIALTKISTQSSLNDITISVTNNGGKLNEKDLAQGANPKNDEVLTTAEANSKFDEAYSTILKKQLEDYQILLENAASGASEDQKSVLASAYEQAGLLLEELKAAQ